MLVGTLDQQEESGGSNLGTRGSTILPAYLLSERGGEPSMHAAEADAHDYYD
jgi:hypothetical protein